MYNNTCPNENYYCAKIQKMATISRTIYNNLAQILLSRIGESNYFNGSVEVEDDDRVITLKATLIIYREPSLDPADKTETHTHISDIVPVWWESFSTCGAERTANEFSWREFRAYLTER